MTTTIWRRGAGFHGGVGEVLRFLRITGCALVGSLMAQTAFAQTAPVGVPDFALGNEDEILTIDVLANDTDAEDGFVQLLSLGAPPARGSVAVLSGAACEGSCDAIEYTPQPFFGGEVTFTYFPVDSGGQVGNETTVTLTITRVTPNQAPIAVADSVTTLSAIDSGGAFGVNVLANDSDPDGDPLTVTAVGSAVNGSVTLESGTVIFRPQTYFRGEASFSYEIWDGITAQPGDPQPEHFASATVTVTVENRPPNPQSPTATTVAGQSIGFAAISTEPDPELDSVSVTSFNQPANGSVIASGDTGFEYTPNPGFTGVDTFSFVISDPFGATANSLATVTVTANTPPVAVDDVATTRAGPTAGEQIDIDVLANDSDPDGDPLEVSVPVGPSNGTLIVTPSGALRYTPNAGFSGLEQFAYEITDGVNDPVAANVAITVNASLAPVAVDDTGQVSSWISGQGPPTSVQITILDNDSDPDGDVLAYADVVIVQQPANGSVTFSCVGACSPPEYQPNSGFVGTDTFTYQAVDALGAQSNIATVTVTVTGTNSPPEAVDDVATTRAGPTAGEQIDIDVLVNDSDPDGDPLEVSVPVGPSNGTLIVTPSGALRYTPNSGFSGLEQFAYEITDGVNAAVSANVTITVNADNPPVAVDDSASTGSGPGESVVISVLANDTDPDGDVLAYSDIIIVDQPTNGTVTQACVGACNPPDYQPTRGFTGTDTFTYRAVSPLGAQSNIATVTIEVTGSFTTPTAVIAGGDRTIADTDGAAGETVAFDSSQSSDQDGTIVGCEWTVNGTLQSAGCGTGIEFALSDGSNTVALVVIDDSSERSAPASVTITVVPAIENVLPVAVIAGGDRTIADTDGIPGETVTFDSTQSSDADGGIIFCEWSVNGVLQDAACGNNVAFALADGASTVSLIVYDDTEQASAPTSVTITVQANAAPVAVIAGGNRTVADSNGVPGEPVVVDGSGSSDGNGTITSYEWSVNGQPVSGATGAQPTLALADGANAVSLTVVDNSGARSTPASVTITVAGANALPVVTISVGSTNIPDSDGVAGENVPFEGAATDSDGTVATSTFRWTVNDQAVPGANGQVNPTLALLNGSNTITLTATDNDGGEGSRSIVVTVGEASVIADLPGIQGNENLESAAGATESTCSALLKADPSTLSEEQVNLRATCETIFSQVGDNPDQVVAAIEQISSQQVTAQQSAAIDYTSAQLLNVAGRLTALRQGAKGVSFAGLNIASPLSGVPVSALASLSKTLFGEGGSSGEDEGGLLDDRLGIFINGSLRFGDKEATSRETGFDFDTTGVTIGADYRFTDALVAGLAIGYGTGSADFDNNGGWQDSDSFSGSLYGSWYGNRGYIDGIVSMGSVSYDTLRNINLFDGAITDKAVGSTDGTQWAIGVAGGFDFGSGGLRFGPNVALNYIEADIDGFRERTEGTSGLAMAFADQTADSLALKAGGHLNYSLSRKWGILSPHARFDIVRELANDSQRITVRYANDPIVTSPGQPGGGFVIFTDDPDEYYFLWAVGLSAQFVNGLSGFIDYESTESFDTFTSAEVSFGLRYQTRFR